MEMNARSPLQHSLKGQKLIAQGKRRKQHALKGQKLLAQGNALGIKHLATRPVRAKALKLMAFFKAFALTGRVCCYYELSLLGVLLQ